MSAVPYAGASNAIAPTPETNNGNPPSSSNSGDRLAMVIPPLPQDQSITNGHVNCQEHQFRRREIDLEMCFRCEHCAELAKEVGYECRKCGERRCLDCDVAKRLEAPRSPWRRFSVIR